MTGVNPGKHGVYDFTAREPKGYDTYVIMSDARQAPSFWQLASRAGKRVIVYNVPLTYPLERVNGIMVSGLLTPDGARDASYPPEIQKELEEAVPGIVISRHGLFQWGNEAELVKETIQSHEDNFRATKYLMDRQPWDLFVMVFQHTDTIMHYLWKQMEDKGAGLPDSIREIAANGILECYRHVDAKMEQLIQEAGEDTHVIVMSDHGFGRLGFYFGVNTWLLEKGYIKFKTDAFTRFKYLLYQLGITPDLAYRIVRKLGIGEKLRAAEAKGLVAARRRIGGLFLTVHDIDWKRTRAYSYGYCGPIFVNLKGREPSGIVAPGKEYEELLDQLCNDLATVKEPGTNSPLFPEVYRSHDIYLGPYADRGPDLVYYPKNWLYAAAGRRTFEEKRWLIPMEGRTTKDPSILQMRAGYTGTHCKEGIFFLVGPGIRQGKTISDSSIMDLAPTVLALLGVPLPKDMDGRVLDGAMTDELMAQLKITFASSDGVRPDLVPVGEMSAEDEAILVQRLTNLGYLG